MKNILIALLVTILLGIVVGSNLSPVMTVVILNQPTITLPIGIWLAMAIGLGLLSSILIQVVILIDRRLLQQYIRKLQTRLQQSDEDIFTSTSGSESDSSSKKKTARAAANVADQHQHTSTERKSLFNSYRSKSVVEAPRSTRKPPANFSDDESDDWEVEPISNRHLEWEDLIPPRQQNFQFPNRSPKIENDASSAPRFIPQEHQDQQNYPEQRTQEIDSASKQIRREVYDADFRLIQPPYKELVETEFDDDRESDEFEYTEIDEADDFDLSSSFPNPLSSNHSNISKNSDDDDWGFDFEDRDTPVRST